MQEKHTNLALSNLGPALANLSRQEEALASYEKALAVNPADAEALNNLGIVLKDLKRPEEALASYDGALAIKPATEAFNNVALRSKTSNGRRRRWRATTRRSPLIPPMPRRFTIAAMR